MFDEERKLSLREVAYLCGLTIKEAEEEVCDCDLVYDHVCSYHKNPDAKHTLKEWQEMSTRGDKYGMYHYTAFLPVNDIDDYPKTKKLSK